MATFNDATVGTSTGGTTPDFGSSRKSQPNVRKVQFGDGYEVRLTYGLNQNPRVWDLKWTASEDCSILVFSIWSNPLRVFVVLLFYNSLLPQ